MAVPSHPGLVGMTAARLAVEATVHETSGAKSARDKLDAILARGEPVIAFVDQQSIGTWVQPSTLSGYWGYQAVVAGRLDDGTYLVDDRGRTPLHVSPGVMAAARARIGSYKHRLIELRPTGRTVRRRFEPPSGTASPTVSKTCRVHRTPSLCRPGASGAGS